MQSPLQRNKHGKLSVKASYGWALALSNGGAAWTEQDTSRYVHSARAEARGSPILSWQARCGGVYRSSYGEAGDSVSLHIGLVAVDPHFLNRAENRPIQFGTPSPDPSAARDRARKRVYLHVRTTQLHSWLNRIEVPQDKCRVTAKPSSSTQNKTKRERVQFTLI